VATWGVSVPRGAAARARLGGRPGPSEVAYALVTPVTAVVVCYAGLRSMLVTVKSGGNRWRDTYYPLSELRGDSG
jgi:hypothetical protein